MGSEMCIRDRKDWQQLAVIRRMARDLDLTRPHVDAIHGVAIVREDDGLAMSSRNAYLSVENRAIAATLPREMRLAIERIGAGDATESVLEAFRNRLLDAGFDSIDYAEIRDGRDLAPASEPGPGDRFFVAARIGGTRLIDNMPVA